MKTEIGLRKEMIGRVVKVAKDREFAAPGSYLHERFTELEAVGEELRVAAGRQAAAELGFREHASRRSVASAKLHEWMADVASLARSLRVEQFPGVAERFRMPRSQSYQAQQAHTIAFIKTLRELEAIFAPRGIDEEAIAQAEALLEQIEEANGAKITRFLRRIEYTEKLMLTSRRGLAIVREIDAMLQRKLRPTPALLAEWNSARRVHRPRKKRAAKSSPSSPPPPPPEQLQSLAPARPARPRSEAGNTTESNQATEFSQATESTQARSCRQASELPASAPNPAPSAVEQEEPEATGPA